MRRQAIVLAAALITAPLGARAADLVVWWEESFTPAEGAAVEELIAAFEGKSGKQVELVRQDVDQQTAAVQAAIDAGRPPDFLFGQIAEHVIPRWAEEGRLVDLTDIVEPFKDMFDADTLELATLRNGRDQRIAFTLCQWPSTRHTSTSGRACWSRRGSRWMIFQRIGMLFGRSGAIGSSRRCARLWGATTSGERG
jgi:Bacterial extracellular solute-binding protein